MIELTLPWPPSLNRYYRTVHGRILISKEGREYRELVAAAFSGETIKGSVGVYIWAHPPDRRKRDLDNLLKGLLDALQHACVYDDDAQIDRIEIVRKYNVFGGKVEVFVSKIEY